MNWYFLLFLRLHFDIYSVKKILSYFFFHLFAVIYFIFVSLIDFRVDEQEKKIAFLRIQCFATNKELNYYSCSFI